MCVAEFCYDITKMFSIFIGKKLKHLMLGSFKEEQAGSSFVAEVSQLGLAGIYHSSLSRRQKLLTDSMSTVAICLGFDCGTIGQITLVLAGSILLGENIHLALSHVGQTI
jgi:hypothetical protein